MSTQPLIDRYALLPHAQVLAPQLISLNLFPDETGTRKELLLRMVNEAGCQPRMLITRQSIGK